MSEKDLVLRGWQGLDEDAVVREVATKGKYIDLCLEFLAEKKQFTELEARIYFDQKVDVYCNRLIKNRQLFKVEHVLKNLRLDSSLTFFQKSQEIEEFRDFILEHLAKQIPDWNVGVSANFHLHWRVFRCLQSGQQLVVDDIDFTNMTFSKFYHLEANVKQKIAIISYFRCELADIAQMLEKAPFWRHLLEQKYHDKILQWVQLQTALKAAEPHIHPRLIINAKELQTVLKDWQHEQIVETTVTLEQNAVSQTEFEQSLVKLFEKWPIDEAMVAQLQEFDASKNEAVLNGLAGLGYFVESEKTDIEVVLRRLIAAKADLRVIRDNAAMNKLLVHYFLHHRLFVMLCDEALVDQNLLRELDDSEHQAVIELILALKELFGVGVSLERAIKVSKKVSKIVLEKDAAFYSNNPAVKLFEDINDITLDNYDAAYRQYFAKFSHLNAFVDRLNNPTAIPLPQLIDLARTAVGIDMVAVNNRLTNGLANTDLYFGNPSLSERYGFKFRLGYAHFVRQHRSAHAAFVFVLEQLRAHGKVAKPQIMTAAKKVSEIAIANHTNRELCNHCVAFVEMLGVDSSRLRATLRCLAIVGGGEAVTFTSSKHLAAMLESDARPLGVIDLEASKMFCETFDLPLPLAHFKGLARHNEWVEFVLMAEYLQYPRKQVMAMCREHFTDTNMGLNLWRALNYDSVAVEGGKRKLSVSLKRRMSFKTELSVENATQLPPGLNESANFLSVDHDIDLFAVLLQSSSEEKEAAMEWVRFKSLFLTRDDTSAAPTSHRLLKRSIKMRWPLLSVLAVDENPDLLDFAWLTWLLTSIAVNPEEPLTVQSDSFTDCAQQTIERAVRNECTAALLLSFQIFYPDSPFVHLAAYLDQTYRHNFTEEVTEHLKKFLQSMNSGQDVRPDICDTGTECFDYAIRLLIVHVGHNFRSQFHQQLFLQSLCDSDIGYFNTTVDFGLLRQVFEIIEFTDVEVTNFGFFCRNVYKDEQIREEYGQIRDRLIAGRYYDKALALSSLLKMEKEPVVYAAWVNGYESDPDGFDVAACEAETQKYGVKPILKLKFYIYVSKRPDLSDLARYRMLKRTLDAIKKYGLYYEFDRDAIEYEMLLVYVRFEASAMDTDSNSSTSAVELEVYHSEYYESVLSKERGVLYSPFVDLKEIAGIDDLTVAGRKLESQAEIERLEALIHVLLDEGDIIQALRCQAIFDHRPLDLHFIVFCMALAEDLVTLYDLPRAERELLNDNLNTVAIRFNKRTLLPSRMSQTSMSSSPSRTNPLEAADTSGNLLEFEEIPSREKQDVLEAIEGLASKIQHGIKLVRRVVMIYRAAMYLDKGYTDILKIKNADHLLHLAVADDCLNKLVVVHDIFTCMEMTTDEVADYISQQIAASIIQSRFYIVQNVTTVGSVPTTAAVTEQRDELWGFDLHDQFHLILELCPDTTLLGHYLLEYCEAIKLYRDLERDKPEANQLMLAKRSEFQQKVFTNLLTLLRGQVLSHKKQNTINVELLIKAHDCFVHECSMEGIVAVLQRCKNLTNTLTNAKSWNLIVKLLVGVGRFGEMYYCFDTLVRNDQFESLLGQFNEKHTKSLKTAIIAYLNEHHPGNTDYFRLAALHFLMYRELAEMWQNEAQQLVAKTVGDHESAMVMEKKFELTKKGDAHKHPKIMVPYLRCTPTLLADLATAMDDWVHATENHLLDNQLAMAQKLVAAAELVALQINLANKCLESTSSLDGGEALCVNVLGVRTYELLQYLANYELTVPQALILERAMQSVSVNWTEAIYIRYVLMSDDRFFRDYLERMDLTETMIENIVKNFQLESKITKAMELAVVKLLEHIPTVTLRYRLASVLGMKRIIFDLINSDSAFYMKDTDYGRKNEEL